MLFNNPNSHRTVESEVMTCSENDSDLFKVNSNSLLFGKLRGSWTKELFYGKHETGPNDEISSCMFNRGPLVAYK